MASNIMAGELLATDEGTEDALQAHCCSSEED
jgi:hypothetical protein